MRVYDAKTAECLESPGFSGFYCVKSDLVISFTQGMFQAFQRGVHDHLWNTGQNKTTR